MANETHQKKLDAAVAEKHLAKEQLDKYAGQFKKFIDTLRQSPILGSDGAIDFEASEQSIKDFPNRVHKAMANGEFQKWLKTNGEKAPDSPATQSIVEESGATPALVVEHAGAEASSSVVRDQGSVGTTHELVRGQHGVEGLSADTVALIEVLEAWAKSLRAKLPQGGQHITPDSGGPHGVPGAPSPERVLAGNPPVQPANQHPEARASVAQGRRETRAPQGEYENTLNREFGRNRPQTGSPELAKLIQERIKELELAEIQERSDEAKRQVEIHKPTGHGMRGRSTNEKKRDASEAESAPVRHELIQRQKDLHALLLALNGGDPHGRPTTGQGQGGLWYPDAPVHNSVFGDPESTEGRERDRSITEAHGVLDVLNIRNRSDFVEDPKTGKAYLYTDSDKEGREGGMKKHLLPVGKDGKMKMVYAREIVVPSEKDLAEAGSRQIRASVKEQRHELGVARQAWDAFGEAPKADETVAQIQARLVAEVVKTDQNALQELRASLGGKALESAKGKVTEAEAKLEGLARQRRGAVLLQEPGLEKKLSTPLFGGAVTLKSHADGKPFEQQEAMDIVSYLANAKDVDGDVSATGIKGEIVITFTSRKKEQVRELISGAKEGNTKLDTEIKGAGEQVKIAEADVARLQKEAEVKPTEGGPRTLLEAAEEAVQRGERQSGVPTESQGENPEVAKAREVAIAARGNADAAALLLKGLSENDPNRLAQAGIVERLDGLANDLEGKFKEMTNSSRNVQPGAVVFPEAVSYIDKPAEMFATNLNLQGTGVNFGQYFENKSALTEGGPLMQALNELSLAQTLMVKSVVEYNKAELQHDPNAGQLRAQVEDHGRRLTILENAVANLSNPQEASAVAGASLIETIKRQEEVLRSGGESTIAETTPNADDARLAELTTQMDALNEERNALTNAVGGFLPGKEQEWKDVTARWETLDTEQKAIRAKSAGGTETAPQPVIGREDKAPTPEQVSLQTEINEQRGKIAERERAVQGLEVLIQRPKLKNELRAIGGGNLRGGSRRVIGGLNQEDANAIVSYASTQEMGATARELTGGSYGVVLDGTAKNISDFFKGATENKRSALVESLGIAQTGLETLNQRMGAIGGTVEEVPAPIAETPAEVVPGAVPPAEGSDVVTPAPTAPTSGEGGVVASTEPARESDASVPAERARTPDTRPITDQWADVDGLNARDAGRLEKVLSSGSGGEVRTSVKAAIENAPRFRASKLNAEGTAFIEASEKYIDEFVKSSKVAQVYDAIGKDKSLPTKRPVNTNSNLYRAWESAMDSDAYQLGTHFIEYYARDLFVGLLGTYDVPAFMDKELGNAFAKALVTEFEKDNKSGLFDPNTTTHSAKDDLGHQFTRLVLPNIEKAMNRALKENITNDEALKKHLRGAAKKVPKIL